MCRLPVNRIQPTVRGRSIPDILIQQVINLKRNAHRQQTKLIRTLSIQHIRVKPRPCSTTTSSKSSTFHNTGVHCFS